MTEKLKVSREVAVAIEKYFQRWMNVFDMSVEEVKGQLISTHNEMKNKGWDAYQDGAYKAMEGISTFDLMQVLVNGYEVEMTPHEIIADKYESYYKESFLRSAEHHSAHYLGYRKGIKFALDTLNITVKGVNDNDNNG